MKYIILTALLFLHTLLSASNVSPEEAKGSHFNLSYMGSTILPAEMKVTVLDNPGLSPKDIGYFGSTSQSNYQLVSHYYPTTLTLGALRYQIKRIFGNHNSFDNAEEAIDAANLFLEAYFPNENAIDAFIDIYLPIQDIQKPYKAFLEHVSHCFPNDKNKDYFEMRKQIISRSGGNISMNGNQGSFWKFNTAFFPPEILNRRSLQHLSLNDNQLQFLPDISNLTNLQILSLNDNQLQFLPDISNLTNLKELDLSHNQLRTVPGWFANLTNLRRLDLSHNQLRTVPEGIANLTNLWKLDLKGNHLETVPEWIANLPNLEVLKLK